MELFEDDRTALFGICAPLIHWFRWFGKERERMRIMDVEKIVSLEKDKPDAKYVYVSDLNI
jgi:hypothetical protein